MKIKFTGTGDGKSIPVVGCRCDRCVRARRHGGRDRRRRVSVVIRAGRDTIVFDTPSSINDVINEEKIFHISAIFLSHKHFDHIGGITAFEYWPKRIPVYGSMSALGNFETTDRLYEKCEFHVLHDKEVVAVGKVKVTPFEVEHKVPTFGLEFTEGRKRLVHFNDKAGTALNEYEEELVRRSNLVVFHTPGYHKGTDHIDIVSVVKIAKKYPDTRFVVTHIGHQTLSHEQLEKKLSPYDNITVAFDGLEMVV